MKTLIGKELVIKVQQRNAHYYLTEKGQSLAAKLYQMRNGASTSDGRMNGDDEDVETLDSDDELDQIVGTNTNTGRFTLPAGSFDIILCIDNREQSSKDGSRAVALVEEFEKMGVKAESRVLPVGDFLWIARDKSEVGRSIGRELILDYIIERKRLDDLCHSITDGRWREQKFRLMKSGLRSPIYVIEGFGVNTTRAVASLRLKPSLLTQAMINAQVIDGFETKYVKDSDAFQRFIKTIHFSLVKNLSHYDLHSATIEDMRLGIASFREYITYSDLLRCCSKYVNFTVKEMFAKHLMQIKGLSLSQVKAVLGQYPTPASLFEAYKKVYDDKKRDSMLADLDIEGPNQSNSTKRLGPKNSKKIASVYTSY